MELDDLKKIWNRMEERQIRKEYSLEEISAFRNARSHDFTAWIRTSLDFDIVLKLVVAGVLSVMTFLYRIQPEILYGSLGTLILVAMMIPYLLLTRKAAEKLDYATGTLQETLQLKIRFLRKMYYKVQFIQNLTNPFIVIAGMLIYYYVVYGFVPPFHYNDWVVTITLIVLSFLVTLPATLSLYGFQLRNLEGCLSSLTDPDGWEQETDKFRKRRKMLSFLLYGLLVVGIILLAAVMLL